MTIKQLSKDKWSSFFSSFPKGGQYEEVHIEAISDKIGDQIDAEWEPLKEICFDASNNELEITTQNVGHFIRAPSEVYVDETSSKQMMIEVLDSEGTKYILRIRNALALAV